ncbi:hypothetical protein BDF19DRAFT_389081 [Syncephalis fuscata]|nr:hypothetical protein BDF19DRAFT_389081 [Syncephalis fuscata]
MGAFDLEQQLIFYGSYHSNRINVLCHIICVPLILWSAMVLTSAFDPIATIDTGIFSKIPVVINVPFSAALLYSAYYMLLEPAAGMLMTPILCIMSITATGFYNHAEAPIKIAIFIQVFSWFAQIFTHHVFEKRSPALLDNFAQALLQAPLFVFLEILFAFGYRPTLHKKVRNQVGIKSHASAENMRPSNVNWQPRKTNKHYICEY